MVAALSRNSPPSADDGKRFARYELRGTFRVRLLRALSGIEGESEGEGVSGVSLNLAVGGFFFGGFSLEKCVFLAPRGSQDGPPTWTEVGPRLGGVLEAFLGGSWGDLGASWGRLKRF